MKIVRHCFGLLLAFILLTGLLPPGALAAPEYYGLKIGGIEITSENWYRLPEPYNRAFQYAPATKTLSIVNDVTVTDSSVDTLLESNVEGLKISVWGNYTLSMNNSEGTLMKFSRDAVITTTVNRDAGSLTLRNGSPGGLGILVDNCSLTLDYLFDLNAEDVTYGIIGHGANAALKTEGTALRIDSTAMAISGFSKGLEILEGEILTPENGKISGGTLCHEDGTAAEVAVIRNTAWAAVLTDTDEHDLLGQDLALSTLGRLDPETGTYQDYDIDLMELYNSTGSGEYLTFYAFNLVQGAVPPGMSLVIGPSDAYPESHTALRLRGRPTMPGSYTAGLWISGKTAMHPAQSSRLVGNVRITVNYESNTEYYDLWIDGIQADSAHLTDLLGDGAFAYAPESKTLTILKSYASDWASVLIRSRIEGLTVETPQDAVLSAGSTVFQLEKHARFAGEGQLTVNSAGNYGILVKEGAFLNIMGADLAVSAAGTAVAGANGGEKLFVTDARLYAKGGTTGVAGFSGGISLTEPGVAISDPPGGKVAGGSIVSSDDSPAPEVLIAPVKTYDLNICGTIVTEANRKDVLGDGVFSFDGVDTLHIKGNRTSTYSIIDSGIEGLVIAVDQDSVLAMEEYGMGFPILLRGGGTITGPGCLTLTAVSYNPGLESSYGKDLILKDLVLTVENGNQGIVGGGTYWPNKLIVENSMVRASVNNTWNTAIQNFAGGIELIGCVITAPSGGKVSDTVTGMSIVDADGGLAKEVTISPLIPVTGLTLNKSALSVAVGASEALTAAVYPENASLKTVYWQSSDPTVAEVDAGGKVTGISKGEAVITARSNGGPWVRTCAVTVTDPIPVAAVTLNRTTLSLPVGNFDFLIPTVSPSNATDKTVTWQSSDPGVAAITADGKVTAVAEGTATITVKAKDGSGKTAECAVTVTAPIPVAGVTLDKTELTLSFTGSDTLTATVSPADASNKLVTWQSSDPTVAEVNGVGKVKAVSEGTATITVTTADGGKIASCTVTVEPQIHVTGVKLNQTALTLVLGQSPFDRGTLTSTVSPANADFQGVAWSSSDPSVATVYHGAVTAQGLGTAVITVTTDDGARTAACTVTVVSPVHVTGLSLDRDEISLRVGETAALTPVIKPDTATNKLVIWESNKPGVADVDSYGIVTGKAEGTAIITAKTVDGAKTAVCFVTVSGELYTYYPGTRSVRSSDAVTPASPLIVASYDGKGRLLRTVFFTGPELKNTVIGDEAKYAAILWIDLATGKPRMAARKFTLG